MGCLATHGSELGVVDMPRWRADYAKLLGGADLVIVPDNDVLTRLHRHFDTSNFAIRPHEIFDIPPPTAPRPRRAGPARVVALGAISDIKGFHVLVACAEHARQHDLPLSFHVIGYTMNDARALAAGISISGAYAPDEALVRLLTAEPDLVFFPFTWPETYSYTLSVALQAGLPLATFDIGAPARRLREAGVGRILPLSMAADAGAINAALMAAVA
jgi:glycosyltransferase involved in cell wall biosynthesis